MLSCQDLNTYNVATLMRLALPLDPPWTPVASERRPRHDTKRKKQKNRAQQGFNLILVCFTLRHYVEFSWASDKYATLHGF